MLKYKLILVGLIFVVAFMLGIGGDIVADALGYDITQAVFAGGCDGGGTC